MSESAKRMNVFERYLSLWVAACMVLGVAIGRLAPGLVAAVRGMEFGSGSQIRIAIGMLMWLPLPNSIPRIPDTRPGASLPIATPSTMQAATQRLR